MDTWARLFISPRWSKSTHICGRLCGQTYDIYFCIHVPPPGDCHYNTV